MKKVIIISIFIIILLVLIGYLFFSRLGLKSDLEKVLKSSNIQITSLNCKMLGSGSQRTRAGVCQGDVKQSDINSVISNLKLEELSGALSISLEEVIGASTTEEFKKKNEMYEKLQENENFRAYEAYTMNKEEGSCSQNENFRNPSAVKLYISKSKIEIGNGGVFRYMLLYFNQESEKACMQVEYSYG
jgi:hypothetical protein